MTGDAEYPNLLHALQLHQAITDHLMTWEEIDAYALGYVSFVASVLPSGEIVMQGVDNSAKVVSIKGKFLHLEFDRYWVCSPTSAQITKSPMTQSDYKSRMAAWLEQIPMLPHDRLEFNSALANVRGFDHSSFEDFTDLLLSNPVTQYEIRCDLVAQLCSPADLALLYETAMKQSGSKSTGAKSKVKNKHLH